MKISVGLPTHHVDEPDQWCTAAAITEMAAAAEAAGADAVFVTDHPAPDVTFMAKGGHHALDPFVALTVAATATTSLRLHFNLAILAYRNPFISAKAIATLDLVSNGRVILGTGAGYLAPEFAAVGGDFDQRNDVTDEAILDDIGAYSAIGVHALTINLPGATRAEWIESVRWLGSEVIANIDA